MLSQFIKDIENLIERAQDNGIKNKEIEKSILDIVDKKFKQTKKPKKKKNKNMSSYNVYIRFFRL